MENKPRKISASSKKLIMSGKHTQYRKQQVY